MSVPRPAPRSQRGGGLIEILVAVVVVSIGFLAVARMQVEGMRFSQGAYHRSQAYFMASDIVDRMRANVAGVRAGHYDAVSTAAGLEDPGCGARQCLPDEIADQDRFDWSALVHPSADGAASARVPVLPSMGDAAASGTVAGADGRYTVTVRWPTVVGRERAWDDITVSFATEL